jgi:hypothetical protein
MLESKNKALSLFILILLLVSPNLLVFAQGDAAVPFLLISPTSRNTGMGETGTGQADDASAIFWNPGGLAFQRGQEISLTHTNWLPAFQQSDLFYEYLNYRIHLDEIGTFGASVTYLNLGEFIRTSSQGPEEIGRFKAFEYAVTVGFSTKVMDNFGLGLNLRLIHSALSPVSTEGETGSGVATSVSGDIGILYKLNSFTLPVADLNMDNVFSFGLSLTNLGPKITYIDKDQGDPIPTTLRLGISAKIFESDYNSLTGNLDFSRLLVRRYTADTIDGEEKIKQPDEFYKALITSWGDGGLAKIIPSFGFEYWYGKPRLIAIRFGGYFEPEKYGNRKYLTFGAGIRWDLYGFDFSYISTMSEDSPLANTIRFSILLNF